MMLSSWAEDAELPVRVATRRNPAGLGARAISCALDQAAVRDAVWDLAPECVVHEAGGDVTMSQALIDAWTGGLDRVGGIVLLETLADLDVVPRDGCAEDVRFFEARLAAKRDDLQHHVKFAEDRARSASTAAKRQLATASAERLRDDISKMTLEHSRAEFLASVTSISATSIETLPRTVASIVCISQAMHPDDTLRLYRGIGSKQFDQALALARAGQISRIAMHSLSSWSENEQIAAAFAKEGRGVVLTIDAQRDRIVLSHRANLRGFRFFKEAEVVLSLWPGIDLTPDVVLRLETERTRPLARRKKA